MAEYRRGRGPDALPQGAATQLNAANPGAEDYSGTPMEPFGAEVPVQFAPDAEEPLPEDRTLSENMQILTAPPNPQFAPPFMSKRRMGRVPQTVVRSLPLLMAASRDPEAPAALRALYRRTVRDLEDEMHRDGS